MANYREQGIVLRTYKLGETDRILHLLTQGRGKVRAVAKGIRRPGSKFGGRLEPFTHVEVEMYQGRNLDIVQQVETITTFTRVREDFTLSACASTMAELVDGTAQEGQRDNAMFLLLRAGLQALDAQPPYPAIFLDAFLLRMAGVLGAAPFTETCAVCRAPGPHVNMSIVAGGMLCPLHALPSTQSLAPETIAMIALLNRRGDWTSLPAAADDEASRVRAASFVRAWVEHHLDRHLRSWEHVPR